MKPGEVFLLISVTLVALAFFALLRRTWKVQAIDLDAVVIAAVATGFTLLIAVTAD